MKVPGKSFPARFCAVFGALALVAYAPFLVGLPFSGSFRSLERNWHDASFSILSPYLRGGDERLILISVDDETVKKYGFPLPRIVYAKALEKLRSAGVKTAIFDVLFLEKREGDRELGEATRRHGGTVHLYIVEAPPADGAPAKVQMTIPELRRASRAMGSPVIGQHIDDDGHIRTFSLFNASIPFDPIRKGRPVTSLAAAGLSIFAGRSLDELEAAFPAEEAARVLNYRRPREWLRREAGGAPGDAIYGPYRWVSLLDLLSGTLSPAQKKALKGSLVIVGSTTTGYYDHYPTPFSSHSPGAEYHLNVIDNVLSGDALAAVGRGWVLLLILLAAWLPYLFHRLMSPAASSGATAAALAALVLGCLGLQLRGLALYPVAPGLTLLAGFLVLTVHRVLTEGAEKRMIKSMFGQFVAPEVVEELASDPEKAKLGAQKREMTVLFLDIAHFTTISEKMGPEALMKFLNRYLSALSHEILERRGTIDKYIGDCIMAFWNAPLENKDHRLDACLASIACQRAIGELNKSLDPGMPEIPAIRIGLNSGEMNVGFTGTERKLQYTVIGDEVNLASRLEGANKFFGSRILVSESVYEGAARERIVARELGRVRVVGKSVPIRVFELIEEKGRLGPEWEKALPVYERGFAAFHAARYEEALAAFEDFLKIFPKDGPANLYRTISRDYAAIPPDDWDGVFNLTAK